MTSSRLAGARSGAPCASEQQPSSTAATTTPTAAMSRAKTGAVAPHPTHHLVWRLLARARVERHHGQARSAPVGAPQVGGEAGSRMHVHLGGSGAHRTAAVASSTRPQRGRTAAAAASPAAAARCSRGRRSAAAGGCCGGAASCDGGLAAQPMSDTRHQHMGPGAAPTSKHLHSIATDPLTSLCTGGFHLGQVTGVFNL